MDGLSEFKQEPKELIGVFELNFQDSGPNTGSWGNSVSWVYA